MNVTAALVIVKALIDGIAAAQLAGRDRLTDEETAAVRQAQTDAEQRWAGQAPKE